ncbi:phospholipase D family protein [Tabrizicola sp. J26]|uniref:phospholipase D family protein n=1 Tax=Alitabrizicola rongguiensis TaxID=2909234 RepID=UPI001F4657A3|nr:phospholipase D family protein [Tabrizicola rongguiensis]MCF1708700.1 phospholipase D family protein [Tabrizicola rongguiensis]
MQNEAALDPQNRALYTDILRAPHGYRFDCALATTYTLDFETALVIPASLAFQAAESRSEVLDTPLALLEGLERNARRIAIFCESGRIQGTPKGVSRLTALLEDTITEVRAPRGGAFHPKIWLLRFTAGNRPPRLRLALLSRNITKDASWDLSLALDGARGPEENPENQPIVELLSRLPDLASGRRTPPSARGISETLAQDLKSTIWDLPPGFARAKFAVNGLSEKCWKPPVGRNLGVISPFVTDDALIQLTRGLSPTEARLLSREDELANLMEDTRSRFGRIDTLDDFAEAGEGEDGDSDDAIGMATGLHAKVFVTERKATTLVTVGSGNATTSALINGRNVEVFATLSGPTEKIGSTEDQFSAARLGRFLRPYEARPPRLDSVVQAAEKRVEAGLAALSSSKLTMRCRRDDDAIRLTLSAENLRLPDALDLQAWPLVAGPNHAVDAGRLADAPVKLGTVALRDVTRWLGFRLVDREAGIDKLVSIGAEIEGLPADRNAEILRSVIENRDAFLKYLALLLDSSEQGIGFSAAMRKGRGWREAAGEEVPLFEELVRAFSRDENRLGDVDRLIERLGPSHGTDGVSVIPADFLDLWRVFRQAMRQGRNRKGAGHA